MESKIERCRSVQSLRRHLLEFVNRAAAVRRAHNEKTDERTVRAVYDFIRNNHHRDISLEEIAEAVALTPNYLANKFKQRTGRTVMSRLTDHRMDRAKELLSKTTLKVYEIAERTGYNNSNYFCQVFKKAVGVSPRVYRNSPPS
jgi:two-component system response regulator YesN